MHQLEVITLTDVALECGLTALARVSFQTDEAELELQKLPYLLFVRHPLKLFAPINGVIDHIDLGMNRTWIRNPYPRCVVLVPGWRAW